MNKPINILLIDDNHRSQDLFGFALNDLDINYCCRFAKSINQAFNMLRLQPADYIFIDINMPTLNGFSTLKKLVTTQFIKMSSIVIYSEQLENALCKKAMQLGIRAGLQKKTEVFQLIQDLKKILFKNDKQSDDH